MVNDVTDGDRCFTMVTDANQMVTDVLPMVTDANQMVNNV
jgi:hypothetical protein